MVVMMLFVFVFQIIQLPLHYVFRNGLEVRLHIFARRRPFQKIKNAFPFFDGDVRIDLLQLVAEIEFLTLVLQLRGPLDDFLFFSVLLLLIYG